MVITSRFLGVVVCRNGWKIFAARKRRCFVVLCALIGRCVVVQCTVRNGIFGTL